MTARTSRSLPSLPVWLLSVACASPRSVESPSEPSRREEPETVSPRQSEPALHAEEKRTASPAEGPAPSLAESPTPGTPELGDSDWLTDGRPPDPKKGLPEVSMRHIGMHIGGESNSDESKRPWLRAIEREQTRVLLCYRSVREPLAGGTVGVDLYVGKAGGKADIRKTRQRLGEADFDDCVRQAFGAMRFPAPARPTVVSYSLRFDVRDPTTARSR